MENVDAPKISTTERIFNGLFALVIPAMILSMLYPANLAAVAFRWVAAVAFSCMVLFGIYFFARRAITGRAW